MSHVVPKGERGSMIIIKVHTGTAIVPMMGTRIMFANNEMRDNLLK